MAKACLKRPKVQGPGSGVSNRVLRRPGSVSRRRKQECLAIAEAVERGLSQRFKQALWQDLGQQAEV